MTRSSQLRIAQMLIAFVLMTGGCLPGTQRYAPSLGCTSGVAALLLFPALLTGFSEQSGAPATSRPTSSCDRYRSQRPAPTPAFRTTYFDGDLCTRNGPGIGKKCLQQCMELGGRLGLLSEPALQAAEDDAVRRITHDVERLRALEDTAARDTERMTALAVPAADTEPAEPPPELSSYCRRYLEVVPGRSSEFLRAFGSRSRCWKGSPEVAQACDMRCWQLLSEVEQSTP